MFKTFQDLYKSKYNETEYFKGFKITIGGFSKIENDIINECLAKAKLLISEITSDFTMKIVKKHMTPETKSYFEYKHFHLCRIDRIEILILNLNEGFEILPLTSVLKN